MEALRTVETSRPNSRSRVAVQSGKVSRTCAGPSLRGSAGPALLPAIEKATELALRNTQVIGESFLNLRRRSARAQRRPAVFAAAAKSRLNSRFEACRQSRKVSGICAFSTLRRSAGPMLLPAIKKADRIHAPRHAGNQGKFSELEIADFQAKSGLEVLKVVETSRPNSQSAAVVQSGKVSLI